MSKPIKPSDISVKKKKIDIPSEVIEVFNQLIKLHHNYETDSAIVTQKEAINALVEELEITEEEIIEKHYLDIEDEFRAGGWVVTYDKPGYIETYEPFFKFEGNRVNPIKKHQ